MKDEILRKNCNFSAEISMLARESWNSIIQNIREQQCLLIYLLKLLEEICSDYVMYILFVISFAFITKHMHASYFRQQPVIKAEYHPTNLCFVLQSFTFDRNWICQKLERNNATLIVEERSVRLILFMKHNIRISSLAQRRLICRYVWSGSFMPCASADLLIQLIWMLLAILRPYLPPLDRKRNQIITPKYHVFFTKQ